MYTLYGKNCPFVLFPLYSVQCPLYTVQWTLYNVHCKLYSGHCTEQKGDMKAAAVAGSICLDLITV